MWRFAICRDGKQKFNLIPYFYRMKDGSYRHYFHPNDMAVFTTKKEADAALVNDERSISVWLNV